MRVTVLGGCGAWPEAGGACSGFLVEHDGFRVVLDLGYATLPRLLGLADAAAVDAVLVSHGHPDHCVDVNPLLRARALRDHPPAPLPLYAPPGALDAVLALDGPRMLAGAYTLPALADRFQVGPFRVQTRALPHFVPNAGIRLSAGGASLAYTGDSGPSPEVAALAAGADLLIADATYPEQVPAASAAYLTSARTAAAQAADAGAARLWLTHLWPGTAAADALAAAGGYGGDVAVATGGLAVDL
jgi:ribonuclease BN (tRNA processing enzyme)